MRRGGFTLFSGKLLALTCEFGLALLKLLGNALDLDALGIEFALALFIRAGLFLQALHLLVVHALDLAQRSQPLLDIFDDGKNLIADRSAVFGVRPDCLGHG